MTNSLKKDTNINNVNLNNPSNKDIEKNITVGEDQSHSSEGAAGANNNNNNIAPVATPESISDDDNKLDEDELDFKK